MARVGHTAELTLASLAIRRWAESSLGDGSAGLVMPAALGVVEAVTAVPARNAELTILGLARDGGSALEDCLVAILQGIGRCQLMYIAHASCLLTD